MSHRPHDPEVTIQLTQTQVDQVIRGALNTGNMTALLADLPRAREPLKLADPRFEDQRLSRSLLSGMLMLAAFPADGSYARITDLAQALDMSNSTAHRYASTLLEVGLVERDPRSRLYRRARA